MPTNSPILKSSELLLQPLFRSLGQARPVQSISTTWKSATGWLKIKSRPKEVFCIVI